MIVVIFFFFNVLYQTNLSFLFSPLFYLSLSPQRKCLPWCLLQLWPASTAEAPPSPLPRSLAATATRVQGQQPHPPRSLRSDPIHCTIIIHSTQPDSKLRSPHCTTALLPATIHQLTSLTTAAQHTTRPTQHHLAFHLRLQSSKAST